MNTEREMNVVHVMRGFRFLILKTQGVESKARRNGSMSCLIYIHTVSKE